MNIREWCRDIIRRPDRVAIPIMTHPGIEEMPYTVRQAITDGSIHAQAIKNLASRYPTHAASVIMDLTVEAEAFGADILFPKDEIATVSGHCLSSPSDIRNLRVPSLSVGRIPEYLKASVIAHRDISDRPVFAGCIGPFSLAGRLYDMSDMMMLICSDPQSAHELLEKATTFILRYVAALKATGVEGVLMAEPAAGLLSDADCTTFSSEYIRRIVEKLQDDNFIIILHNCGNTGHCTPAMVKTGAAALHLGNKCDLAEIAASVPSDILVMGNLDPVSVFKQMTPRGVYDATTELLQTTADYPNIVLSSGCDTPPHTPLANIDAFFDAVSAYNAGL